MSGQSSRHEHVTHHTLIRSMSYIQFINLTSFSFSISNNVSVLCFCSPSRFLSALSNKLISFSKMGLELLPNLRILDVSKNMIETPLKEVRVLSHPLSVFLLCFSLSFLSSLFPLASSLCACCYHNFSIFRSLPSWTNCPRYRSCVLGISRTSTHSATSISIRNAPHPHRYAHPHTTPTYIHMRTLCHN